MQSLHARRTFVSNEDGEVGWRVRGQGGGGGGEGSLLQNVGLLGCFFPKQCFPKTNHM